MPYSGVLAICILWSTVSLSLLITKLDVLGKLPISYLGVFAESRTIFNAGLIISALLLLVFAYDLAKKFDLSKRFAIIFSAGQTAQIIVALTPFNSDSIVRPIHVIAGFVIAFTLPLSMYAFMNVDIPRDLRRITQKFLWIEIILFILGIGWFVLASRAGALAEILTALAFDVWIALSPKVSSVSHLSRLEPLNSS